MNSTKIICVALLFAACSSAKYIEYNTFDGKTDNLRIVDGEDASLGQFPHQVSLRHSTGRHFCGASLINSRWILSAAHCVVDTIPEWTTAIVGTISRSNGGKTYSISRIIVNPAYESQKLANDISLLLTQEEIEFSQYVQPIALPTSDLPADTTVTVSGWGRTSFPPEPDQPDLAETLQFVSGQSLSRKECVEHFPDRYAHYITDRVICSYNPGRGTCFGDSGGPLTTDNNILVGIVSWGIPCGTDYPDVYTRVYSQLKFIHEQINQDDEIYGEYDEEYDEERNKN